MRALLAIFPSQTPSPAAVSLDTLSLAASAGPASFSFTVTDTHPLPTLQPHEVLVEVRACSLESHPRFLQQMMHAAHTLPPAAVASAPGPALDLASLSLAPSSLTATVPGYAVSGVVVKLGSGLSSAVTSLAPGDEVAGLIPLDAKFGGFAEYAVLSVVSMIKKPSSVPHHLLAASLLPGVSAITALHYKAHVARGESVLVLGVGSMDGFAFAAAQLALSWGAVVFTLAASDADAQYIASVLPSVRVIRVGSSLSFKSVSIGGTESATMLSSGLSSAASRGKRPLLAEVLRETAGLGLDVVIDFGLVQARRDSGAPDAGLVSKFDIVSCLGVNGRWVTSAAGLQLDPPETSLLQKKNASVCFLNEHAWLLSGAQQGRLIHMLKEVVDRLEDGKMVPKINRTLIKLEDVCEFWQKQIASQPSASAAQYGRVVYEAS